MSHSVTIRRICGQRTSDNINARHVNSLADRAIKAYRRKGWSAKCSKPTAEKTGELWTFESKIKFSKDSIRRTKSEKIQFSRIVERLAKAGNASRFNKYPWKVFVGKELSPAIVNEIKQVEKKVGFPIEPVETEIIVKPDSNIKDYFDYSKLNLDPTKYTDPNGHVFENLYDREHQKKIILATLEAAVKSNFANRYNTCIFGPPAGAKSELLLSMANMLGSEGEAYIKFDATSSTSAGMSKILLEQDFIPSVAIVEEIEKADENSLKYLLGVLDQRAEIRRTNFRIGNKARNVKMLVFATVNDIDLFRKLMSGALASRFSNQIYCPRPNREVLEKILIREVNKFNGKIEWVSKTLEFAFDEMKWDDPRRIIPICLCGREKLMTGEYQESIRKTQLPIELAKKLG